MKKFTSAKNDNENGISSVGGHSLSVKRLNIIKSFKSFVHHLMFYGMNFNYLFFLTIRMILKIYDKKLKTACEKSKIPGNLQKKPDPISVNLH